VPFVRGRGRAGLRGDEYGDEASVSMSSGKPERHAERSPPLPPRGAPRRPCSVKSSVPIFDADEAITCGERGKRRDEQMMSTCMQRDHVPIFDADEAITNGVFARLQMAAHNSAPRSTSEVASVPDEGCNQRFIIKVIRLYQIIIRCNQM
jgi:hypothetical protein